VPLRSNGGGEVMTFPTVILPRGDAVGSHWFEPIHPLDAQSREPRLSFFRAP
jgi:hypothetical protein